MALTDLGTTLQYLRLIAFLGVAIAALRLWWQHRSRPAAFLFAAFGILAATLLTAIAIPEGDESPTVQVLPDLVAVGLATFPWLLALFAWSFEPRFPRWLLATAGGVVLLGVWMLALPPVSAAGSRTTDERMFLFAFLLLFAGLALTAAGRLWTAGGRQPVVRARMRLMSAGALVLTSALLVAVLANPDADPYVPVVMTGLAILAALLFVAGFAPPGPLRLWWRRRVSSEWQQMQTELLAATSPRQAAAAVTPMLADLLGGGAAVISSAGRVLACTGMSDDHAQAAARRVVTGQPAGADDEYVPIDAVWLVVRPTPYTPLFGQDERDMLSGFALQLRIAVERAELFEANQRARDDLERTGDDLEAMMVGLAHDLRSPLVSISGYADLLRTAESDQEREEMVQGIKRSSRYLNQLVDSLVELSRVGSVVERREWVDLNAMLEQVSGRLQMSQSQVTLHVDRLPPVYANALRMEQVLENLLANAAKHGRREDLTVTVTGRAHGDEVRIDVQDNGRGIDPGDAELVFKPFQRGRSASRSGSGVGLGLVRRIVEAHGGRVELVPGDEGAHFRICLPQPDTGAEPARPRLNGAQYVERDAGRHHHVP